MVKLHDEESTDDWDGVTWAEETRFQHIHPDDRSSSVEKPIRHDLNEDGYVLDWRTISARKRADRHFQCEVCRIQLTDRPDLVHVHHLDRDKENNDDNNLQVLCALCHSLPKDHAHLEVRISDADKNLIISRRTEKTAKETCQQERRSRALNRTGIAIPPALSTERRELSVRGYGILAAFWNGAYRGRARPTETCLPEIKVLGVGIDDVLHTLAVEIAKAYSEQARYRRETIPYRHEHFLALHGLLNKGYRSLSEKSVLTLPRKSHCYRCKTAVDNLVDFECSGCGWIVCSACAACGCAWVPSF